MSGWVDETRVKAAMAIQLAVAWRYNMCALVSTRIIDTLHESIVPYYTTQVGSHLGYGRVGAWLKVGCSNNSPLSVPTSLHYYHHALLRKSRQITACERCPCQMHYTLNPKQYARFAAVKMTTCCLVHDGLPCTHLY